MNLTISTNHWLLDEVRIHQDRTQRYLRKKGKDRSKVIAHLKLENGEIISDMKQINQDIEIF